MHVYARVPVFFTGGELNKKQKMVCTLEDLYTTHFAVTLPVKFNGQGVSGDDWYLITGVEVLSDSTAEEEGVLGNDSHHWPERGRPHQKESEKW